MMGDSPSVREKVTKTTEIAIPTPCDWKTFGYWLHCAERTFEQQVGRKPSYDDDLIFTVGDDEMVASFDTTHVTRTEARDAT